jgi:hypothetical protein
MVCRKVVLSICTFYKSSISHSLPSYTFLYHNSTETTVYILTDHDRNMGNNGESYVS